MALKILVADDEIQANKIDQSTFSSNLALSKSIDFVGTCQEVIARIQSEENQLPDLVIIDIKIPESDIDQGKEDAGKNLIERLDKEKFSSKIIIISAYFSFEDVEKYVQGYDNVLAYFPKPLNYDLLKKTIQANFRMFLSESKINESEFGYSFLNPETSEFVQNRAFEIKRLVRRAAEDLVNIGQYLTEVKDCLEHGSYLGWLKQELGWSPATAWRFMQVYKQFKFFNLKNLNIVPSALYDLASPSFSEAARGEAVSRAKAGETITVAKVQEIKQKYHPQLTKTESTPVPVPKNKINNREKAEENLLLTSEKTLPTESRQIPTKSTRQSKSEISEYLPQRKGQLSPVSTQNELIELVSWWQLGEHLLYCGQPTSPQFKKLLPQQIALSIAFPPDRNWLLAQPVKAKSSLALLRGFKDEDIDLFCQTIQGVLELYTETYSSVVFSFLPNPKLFQLADSLGCRCFVAEPDFQQCQAVITAWKEQGGKVRKQ